MQDLSRLLSAHYDQLNSATKYPSIPTYHVIGERGRLTEERNVSFGELPDLEYTEKIDGANTRIIFYNRDWVIGSREEFLYARNDRIRNPAQQIVETILDSPTGFKQWNCLFGFFGGYPDETRDEIVVVYGESHGGKIQKAGKGYGDLQFRIFDAQTIPIWRITKPSTAEIASWRDNEFHNWMSKNDILKLVNGGLGNSRDIYEGNIERFFVPVLDASPVPETTVRDTYEWLQQFRNSQISDCRAEGVVIRSKDHKLAAKVRFEDYTRTLGIKNW